jgi:hypothetical protein
MKQGSSDARFPKVQTKAGSVRRHDDRRLFLAVRFKGAIRFGPVRLTIIRTWRKHLGWYRGDLEEGWKHWV